MASPPWVRLVLILLAGVAACHARQLFDGVAVIDETPQPLRPSVISCSTAGNYTDGSKYHVNLYRLLSAIPVAADSNGTFGVAGDEVFGMFMCYADDADSECQDCLTRAPKGIMKVCPHSRTVRAVYSACTIQYSNESFFSVADLSVFDMADFPVAQTRLEQTPYRSWNNRYPDRLYKQVVLAGYVGDSAGMSHTRFRLIHRLMVKACQRPERIAEGTEGFTDAEWVQAVVQCTRDLPASECTRCLSNYANQLPRLFPNNSGGAIKGSSCYLRYVILADADKPRPRAVRLERYRYSEEYEEENEHERRMETKRREHRRKVIIIAIIIATSVALVVCLISLWVRFAYPWMPGLT